MRRGEQRSSEKRTRWTRHREWGREPHGARRATRLRLSLMVVLGVLCGVALGVGRAEAETGANPAPPSTALAAPVLEAGDDERAVATFAEASGLRPSAVLVYRAADDPARAMPVAATGALSDVGAVEVGDGLDPNGSYRAVLVAEPEANPAEGGLRPPVLSSPSAPFSPRQATVPDRKIEPPSSSVVTKKRAGVDRRAGKPPVGDTTMELWRGLAGAVDPSRCQGAGYPVGTQSIAGWGGRGAFIGAYCDPRSEFTKPGDGQRNSGSFCIDHGLRRPGGVVSSTPSGAGATQLVNQRGGSVPPADVARLSHVLFHHGHQTDRVTAAAVATVVHAVMRDLPGLSPESVVAGTYSVKTDAAQVKAKAAEMWAASARQAAPYRLTVDIPGGAHRAGRPLRGTARLVGRGGDGVAGVPLKATAAAKAHGAEIQIDGPTGTDGSVGFTVTPKAPHTVFTLAVDTDLPGEQVTRYDTGRGRQRLVGTGPATRPRTEALVDAKPLGSAQLVKVSSDPGVATIGEGFRFEIRDGNGKVAAERSTDEHGAIAPVTDLPAGRYQVVETAHPAGFVGAGPWTFELAAGQRATWTIRNSPVRVPLRLHKTSTEEAHPVPPGVTFTLRRLDGSTQGPVGTFRTNENGVTPEVRLAPGRYLAVEVGAPPGFKVAPPTEFVIDKPDAQSGGGRSAVESKKPGSPTTEPASSSVPPPSHGVSTTAPQGEAPATSTVGQGAGTGPKRGHGGSTATGSSDAEEKAGSSGGPAQEKAAADGAQRAVTATAVVGAEGVAVVQVPNTPIPRVPFVSKPTATPSRASVAARTKPKKEEKVAVKQLPETGSSATRLAAVGAGLLSFGLVGLWLVRWRRRGMSRWDR